VVFKADDMIAVTDVREVLVAIAGRTEGVRVVEPGFMGARKAKASGCLRNRLQLR
jgi:hypothetical protein